MSMETFLLIIGVSVIVLVIICMPVVWQVWRAVKGVNVSLGTLNENLPAILKISKRRRKTLTTPQRP